MSEQAAPPPSPAASPASEKAGKGMRALAVLGALVLAFAAAVMLVTAVDISGTPTLREHNRDHVISDDGSYYDGSKLRRTVGVIGAGLAGVLGALAALAALAFSVTGLRGRPILILAGAAIVIGAVAFIIA
ncbi:hypothetical protein BH10ACT11_BH10ACT11_15560 [soil metagenome]